MKRFLTAVIIISMLLSIPACACGVDDVDYITINDIKIFTERIKTVYEKGYEQGEMQLTCAKDAAVLCGLSSASDENGAICIGKLKDRSGYIVTLGGTEVFNKNENLGIREDILAGFHHSNEYKKSVIKAIQDNIPAGEDIYIYGYSLGGMVMQQVLSDRSMRNSYNICAAVTFGSPVTALNRQKIVFLEDSSDLVPSMSAMSLLAGKICRSYDIHIVRDGGYMTTAGGHALSYVDNPIWDDIDLAGQPGGDLTLTIDMEQFFSFAA